MWLILLHSTTAVDMNNIREVNRKLVKPCIPTPPHLKNYKFSFTDEYLPPTEIGIMLFYAFNGSKRIDLEESLAKVLVQFYPLAGRFVMKDSCVDCSDQGAELVEAEAPDVELGALVEERRLQNLYGFFPRKDRQIDAANYPILSIQITQLSNCGGVVVGISISHKIFDASSVSTFVAAWSNAARDPAGESRVSPSLDSWSSFPGQKKMNNTFSGDMINGSTQSQSSAVSVKRFTFSGEAISRARSSLRGGGKGISKVRVACAVIAKALIALDRAKAGRTRDCILIMAVNMRERTVPPLHKHACGNLVMMSADRFVADSEARPELDELVDLIGDAISKSISDCARILSLPPDQRSELIFKPLAGVSEIFKSGEANVASFTDYSKFGAYAVDFGWGKPVWAAIVPQGGKNLTVLMGNREGNGIEAWLHLDNKDVCLFEQDEDIRLFSNFS